jgi:class 3 adenylate cyclase
MSDDQAHIDCPACGESNRPGRRFCGQCGIPFRPECPACGQENEAGERFCGECGTALEAAAAASTGAPEPAASPRGAAASQSQPPLPPRVDDPTSVSRGRYAVQRFLGEGARKRVFLARDQRLDREVALAIVKTEGLDETSLARVRREAEAMGRLGDHPNVVTVFDVEEEQGQVFIVSRYVPGGDLDARLSAAEQGRLPVAEALRIAADVARALQHAHERGVVHRDVKPGNVWLDASNTALLGDFGLAAQSDQPRLTQEGTMLGTVAYMPPEQALGRAADARSDLYALGATLYEMLAGAPPFPGQDTVAVIAQHINSAPVNPSWHEKRVPRALDDLVLRLLAKDPDDRPGSAGEVADALEQIAGEEADRSTSVGTSRSDEALVPASFGVFVGRDRELAQLQEIFARVLSGEGSLAMLVGEPGIGKTRLSKEFSVHAKLRGARVVMGPCYEGEGSLAHEPFIAALREYMAQLEDAPLREHLGAGAPDLAAVVPEIHERFPDLPIAPPLEGDDERQRFFESMASFVSRAAADTPLVMILDDLHWADKPTLLLLLHLARRIRNDRLLLIGTYRDVELERTHPLSETVATLRTDGLYERVLLRGLDDSGVADLLSARAGGQQVPEGFVARIREETEGNPFFVEEVIKHLIEINAIHRVNGEWVGDPSVVERSIPEGVREVIGHRLTRLSERCNAMLTVGSAMTGGFGFAVLGAVCGESEDALLDLLDEALRAQVIRERDGSAGGTYEFSHALIRQTLYHELSTPRRVRLHRQIGEALEKLYGLDSAPQLASLAYHFFQGAPGGDVNKAISTSMHAADHAKGQMAWEEAATHTGRALEALEMLSGATERQRYDLLFALGDAQRMAGERVDSRKHLAEAAELARRMGDDERHARAVLNYAAEDVTVQFDPPEVLSMLEEGLEAVGPGDSELRLRLLSRLAIGLLFSRDPQRKIVLAQEAVAMARRLGDDALLCRALFVYDLVSPTRFDPERAGERAEIWELGLRSNEPNLILGASMMRLWDAAKSRDGAILDAALQEYRERVEAVRQPALIWYTAVHAALVAQLRGPLDDAEKKVEEAYLLGTRCQHPLAEFFHMAHRSQLQQGRGTDPRASEQMLEVFASPLGRQIDVGAAAATSLLTLGRVDEARERFERTAGEDFGDIPRDVSWFGRIFLAARVCAELGDTARARTLRDQIAPYANEMAISGPFALCWGPMTLALGRMEHLLRNLDEAVTQYEDALAGLEGLHFGVLLAPAQLELAHVLVERGSDGDRSRALSLAGEALATAQELAMPPTVEAALALKLELQGIEPSGDVKQSVYLVADAVEQKRPDLGSHAAPDGTVTLLFSDMEGFTSMTERLGDLKAREVIRAHNQVVREQLAAHGGYEVELQGDGFLLAFGSARQALLCAVAIQRAFAARGAGDSEPIRVRIGVHTGEALRDADKFFGKTVILAARIAAEAQGAEILASSLVRDLTVSTGDLRFGSERETALKGISAPQRLVAVNWR